LTFTVLDDPHFGRHLLGRLPADLHVPLHRLQHQPATGQQHGRQAGENENEEKM
jgi:hypothetical protein